MARARSSPSKEDINPDYVRMYYEHQYDRIDKLEGHSFNISNIVITISALIITFGLNNRQSFGPILILFLPLIIIIVNISSILYVNDRARWIKQHQNRAKRILQIYVPELDMLDKETIAPPKKWAIYRRSIQNLIHYLFVIIGILLLIIFVLGATGDSII